MLVRFVVGSSIRIWKLQARALACERLRPSRSERPCPWRQGLATVEASKKGGDRVVWGDAAARGSSRLNGAESGIVSRMKVNTRPEGERGGSHFLRPDRLLCVGFSYDVRARIPYAVPCAIARAFSQ